jgi:hypothetical protein
VASIAGRIILQIALSSFPAGGNTVIGSTVHILHAITDPLIDLVIQERQLPADISTWLDDVPLDAFPRGRVLVLIDDVDVALEAMRESARLSEDPRAARFMEDVGSLARTFATIAQVNIVDIKLDAITHDSCWKFHRDLVDMRLLTTYRGPGTQIVPRLRDEDALQAQRDYDGPVSHLPCHAVALFKGCGLVPGKDTLGKGVVHRSPPILDSGVHRFVLCINKISNASPERWHL